MSVYTGSAWPPGGPTGGSLQPPYYAEFLRENLYGSLYHRQLGTLVTVPRGHGTKAKISKWDTPLTITNGQLVIDGAVSAVGRHVEDTPITLFGLCASDITGEVTGWAGGRGYTSKMIITSMANFIEGGLESLSRELSFRLDAYTRAKISANAFKSLARNRANVAPADDQVTGAGLLFGKNVARIRPLMGSLGLPKWEDGTYVGVAHELASYDMFNDVSATGFVSVARYNNARKIFRGEVGEFYGVRWLLTNAAPRFFGDGTVSATTGLSGGVTGSNAYVFSPDSFYSMELETGGVQVTHQPLGSAGTADPAAQLGSIAVEVFYGIIPTPSAERRIMRLAHATSIGF